MPKLFVVTRDGSEREIPGDVGRSFMEVIHEAGIDDILALCGGCCSCATCHVHVDPMFADKLNPMSEDEDDLIESSADRDFNEPAVVSDRVHRKVGRFEG